MIIRYHYSYDNFWGFQICILSTLHNTQNSHWLHNYDYTYSRAPTHDAEGMTVVRTNQAPGVSICTCLWGIFLKLCSQFFKKRKKKPTHQSKQTKELTPTRIFKPLLQTQGNLTKNLQLSCWVNVIYITCCLHRQRWLQLSDSWVNTALLSLQDTTLLQQTTISG